jgi:hypothetical protein
VRLTTPELFKFEMVQSTARQTEQNCQISPVDFESQSLEHKVQIRLIIFDSLCKSVMPASVPNDFGAD